MQEIIECNNVIQKALSEANLKTKIETPQIAVVGAQSSGKTSVLEMILGVDCLPRGSGIVTKCPLKLQLYHHEEDKSYATFDHNPKVFSDFNEVRQEIIDRTKVLIGDNQDVSSKAIVLRLFSKGVPDLTLIDLPGLVEAAVDGQDKNLPDKIRALVRENIDSKKTIILLINPANVDMANNPALKLVEEVDPRRERTFGVITKLDLMDAGEDAREFLQGKFFSLKHGYIAVKCRSQQDNKDGLSITEAKMKELNFFKGHKVYKNMMSQVGSETLSKKLSLLLAKAIKDDLPNIQKDIEDNILEYTEKMNKLGPSLNFKTEEQAYEYLLNVIDHFCKQLKDTIEGGHWDPNEPNLTGGSYIKKHFESFSKDLIDPIDPFTDLNEAQILTENKKSLGIHSGLFIPEEACKNLIKKNIERFVHPMDQWCESIKDVLYETIQDIIVKCMKGRNKLKFFLQDKALGILEEKYEAWREILKDLVDTESSYINYDNVEFQKLKVIINALEDLELEQLHEYHSHHGIEIRYFQRAQAFDSINKSIKKYMKDNKGKFNEYECDEDGKKGAWRVSPIIDFDTCLTDADREHIMVMKRVIHCYFAILKNKFKSDTPKYVYNYMINKMLKSLNTKLVMSLKGQNAQLIDLTAEDSTVKEKRDEAMNALKKLKIARKAIKDLGKYNLSIIEED